MRLPLIKDGVVVNVVHIGEHKLRLSKAEYVAAAADLAAGYYKRLDIWRQEMQALKVRYAEINRELVRARDLATQAKQSARLDSGDPESKLQRVLSAEAEVDAWQETLNAFNGQSRPGKPSYAMLDAWIIPEGHTTGPADAGLKIGDIYIDGVHVKRDGA